MSRAPNDNVKAYDGSGDWFKIFEEGVCKTGVDFTSNAWCDYDRDFIAAKIPAGTPAGEYLVRVEHIGKFEPKLNFFKPTNGYQRCSPVSRQPT
jgi:hypothetical protein